MADCTQSMSRVTELTLILNPAPNMFKAQAIDVARIAPQIQNVGWVEQHETQRTIDFVGFRLTQPNLLFDATTF
jgi:hypothetical protein